MNSIQESTNELNAAIRYAENAITSAKQTIESMQFRQDMAMKQYTEQTGREQALEREAQELKDKVQGQYDDIVMLEREVADLKERLKMETAALHRFRKEKEASSAPCGCQAYRDLEEKVDDADAIKKLEYDLTAKTAQASAWKKKYYDFKETLVRAEDPRVVGDKPTMPVIPKDVAIAIFREGVEHGVSNACDELDNSTDIHIEESGYSGGFEVSFSKYIDLSEHLDLDWMRDKVGDYDEASVIEALKNLCADKEFECRIHGIDDNPTNND